MYSVFRMLLVCHRPPGPSILLQVLLGTRYSWLELLSVVTVLGAAVLSVFVESSNGTDTNFFWAIFAAATTAFAAASFVLKEKVHRVSASTYSCWLI